MEILNVPDHIKEFRKNNDTVCIDVEIVDTIKHLWKNKIKTLGCCQDDPVHKKPCVVVPTEYRESKMRKITEIIKEIDDREWVIYQWTLVRWNGNGFQLL